MTICIEDADADAILAIMPIMSAAFDPAFGEAWSLVQCRGAMALPGFWMLVARSDDGLCGFAMVRTVLEDAELMLIAVDPACQRTGLGRALLDKVISRCTAQSVTSLHVEMREDNPALSFYMSAGFTIVGQRRNYYRRLDGKSANALTLCRVSTS